MDDNTNRNFKGQHKDEVVLSFTRRHGVVLIPHFVIFLLVISAISAYFIIIPSETLAMIFSPLTYRITALAIIIGLSYYLHRFFLRVLNYYLQTIIITNRRVIELRKTIYFSNSSDSIDLPEIQDIMVHKNGVIKTILNYGEISIILSSAHASKELQYIPNPEYFFKKINKTKAQYMLSSLRQEKRAAPFINQEVPLKEKIEKL